MTRAAKLIVGFPHFLQDVALTPVPGTGFVASPPDGGLVEVIELPDHAWFIGCQFHPELKSRPTRPHPLFAGFIAAALRRQETAPARAAAEELARSTR